MNFQKSANFDEFCPFLGTPPKIDSFFGQSRKRGKNEWNFDWGNRIFCKNTYKGAIFCHFLPPKTLKSALFEPNLIKDLA
jgi:hypothetical protein